jgi:hypothetical protein
MSRSAQRLLAAYSFIVSSILLYAVFKGGLIGKSAHFDEITVERINLVEADGLLRMAISNHDRLPGIIVRGEERPFERPQAGLLFYNDEGSEIGGLIFGGEKDDQGHVINSGASLSFDRYEANQIVQLIGVDDSEHRFAGLIVSDSPSGNEVHRRIWLGREENGVAELALMDAAGLKRIKLEVGADGASSISFLDAEGNVVNHIP